MIALFVRVAILAALVAWLILRSIPRQVRAHHHAKVATLTQMQAIPRVRPYTNGVAASPTIYQPAHTPSSGTPQARS